MSKPRVSIVTPAWNSERWLRETYASVGAQTMTDWEWLVVDDGSTDDTGAVLSDLAARDARVKPLGDGTNHGAAAARNTGLAAATGDLIAFLDSDDRWEPTKLGKQVEYLDSYPDADGVSTWFELFGDPERIARGVRIHPRTAVCSREEALAGTTFLTSSLLMRRSVYDAEGGMDTDTRLRSGQDYEYFFRLVSRYRIHRMHEVLTWWRVEPQETSLSASNRTKDNARGWRLLEVLVDKGLVTEEEARVRRSFLHFEQGRNNLVYLGAPFRRHLLRSVLAGRPPSKAVAILAMSWLPAPVLRPLLLGAQRALKQRLEGAPGGTS